MCSCVGCFLLCAEELSAEKGCDGLDVSNGGIGVIYNPVTCRLPNVGLAAVSTYCGGYSFLITLRTPINE